MLVYHWANQLRLVGHKLQSWPGAEKNGAEAIGCVGNFVCTLCQWSDTFGWSDAPNLNRYWRHQPAIQQKIVLNFLKPGTCPQPAKGQLWACAWFTEIVFQKVCVCMFVCMYSRPLVIRPSFIRNLDYPVLKMTVLLEYFGYRCAF